MADLFGELERGSGDSIDSTYSDLISANTVKSPNRIPIQELHKYVVGLFGVFLLFLITYPIAMSRVSQKGKFALYQFYLKSLTPEYKSIDPK